MAGINLDLLAAERVLRKAHDIAWSGKGPFSPHGQVVAAIVGGDHLTYRYLLVTGLLAKATDPRANGLALQAGSSLTGSYDARSLCHKVIVPLERELLGLGLGGSNEPFLNKPARFPEISLSNAVRKGRDAEALALLHRLLGRLVSQQEAFDALCDALSVVKKRVDSLTGGLVSRFDNDRGQKLAMDLCVALLSASFEGQVPVLVAGACLTVLYDRISCDHSVVVHPVNQSGASSREVGDIDIRHANETVTAFEVKDKPFTKDDVEHAVRKARRSGLAGINFLIGPQGRPIGGSLEDMVSQVAEKTGGDVIFVDLKSFIFSTVGLCHGLKAGRFLETLTAIAKTARMKDEVFRHLDSVSARMMAAV